MITIKTRLKKKISITKFVAVSFVLAIGLVLSVTLPAMSQSNSMLSSSARRISNTEIWWDNLWEATFNPPPITVDDSDAPAAIVDIPELPPAPSLPGSPLPVPSLPPTGSSGNLPAPPPVVNSNSGGNNLSLYFFTSATRTILAVALIGWLFSFGRAMVESPTMAQGIHTFFKLFTPVILSLLFISNQGYYSRILAQGMRGMVNSWSEGVMNLTITDYSVRAATQDQLIAEDAKQEIVNQFKVCESINPPEVALPSAKRPDLASGAVITNAQRKNYDYLDCLDKLQSLAQKHLDIAEQERLCSEWYCRYYRKVADLLTGASEGIKTLEKFRRTNASKLNDPDVQKKLRDIEERVQFSIDGFNASQLNGEKLTVLKDGINGLVHPGQSLLYFTQWMWISFLELAMFLSGLFAPMFFAVSIIPGKDKMATFFVHEFLTIGLAKMAYVVVIGIVAIQQSAPDADVINNTFFMSLGIFAPAVSFAVVTAGSLAAAGSYRSQSVGAIAAIGGLASSGAATIAYSMSRAMDKRR